MVRRRASGVEVVLMWRCHNQSNVDKEVIMCRHRPGRAVHVHRQGSSAGSVRCRPATACAQILWVFSCLPCPVGQVQYEE